MAEFRYLIAPTARRKAIKTGPRQLSCSPEKPLGVVSTDRSLQRRVAVEVLVRWRHVELVEEGIGQPSGIVDIDVEVYLEEQRNRKKGSTRLEKKKVKQGIDQSETGPNTDGHAEEKDEEVEQKKRKWKSTCKTCRSKWELFQRDGTRTWPSVTGGQGYGWDALRTL